MRFEVIFLGRPATGPQLENEPDDADMMVDGIPLAQLLEEYEQQCAVFNEIIAAHSLEDVGKHPDSRQTARTCGGS